MDKKFIICDYAKSDWGKSATLLKVYELLSAKYEPKEMFKIKGDVYAVFEIKEKRIAVFSLGDPDEPLLENLKKAATKDNADVIICAARAYGWAKEQISAIQRDYNYEEIFWFRNFHSEKRLAEIHDVNTIMAEAIIKTAFSLLNI